MSEEVDYGNMAAEKYTGKKHTQQKQEELIPPNRMKALPIRTGALIRPNCLAKIIYTCWIPLAAEELVDITDPVSKPSQFQKTNTKDESYSYDDFLNETGVEV